jgi:hypothetical protein
VVGVEIEVGIRTPAFELGVEVRPEVELLEDFPEVRGVPVLAGALVDVRGERVGHDRLGGGESVGGFGGRFVVRFGDSLASAFRNSVGEGLDVQFQAFPPGEDEQGHSVGHVPVVVEPTRVLERLDVGLLDGVVVDALDGFYDGSSVGVGFVHEYSVDVQHDCVGLHGRK